MRARPPPIRCREQDCKSARERFDLSQAGNLGGRSRCRHLESGALIGSVVVVLALFVTVRLRRRDLALLRVLGFTRAQLTSSVLCQAGVFAAVGLIVGTPLGLVLGRFAWQSIATDLGVATDPAIPVAGIILTALGVAIVAVVAALVPAARAARLRPAEILHQE